MSNDMATRGTRFTASAYHKRTAVIRGVGQVRDGLPSKMNAYVLYTTRRARVCLDPDTKHVRIGRLQYKHSTRPRKRYVIHRSVFCRLTSSTGDKVVAPSTGVRDRAARVISVHVEFRRIRPTRSTRRCRRRRHGRHQGCRRYTRR